MLNNLARFKSAKLKSQIMKAYFKFLFSILIVSFFVSCQQEDTKTDNPNENQLLDVDKATFYFNNNNKKITSSLSGIKAKWEKQILEEDNLKVNLENFELIESFKPAEDIYYYFLKGEDKGGQVSTGAFLIKDKNSLSFELKGKTCTCEGCLNGCSLSVLGSTCRCSPCNPRTSKCIKKESQTVEIQ
jgi:hypothetical protein